MLTIRGYARFCRLAAEASRTLSVVTVVGVVLAALAPLAAVTAVGAVVGAVPGLADGGAGSPAVRTAVWWAVAAGGFFLLQWAAGALQGAATAALGDRIDAVLQRDLMDAVMTPQGIGHLEDPATLNLVHVGRRRFAPGRPGPAGSPRR